MTRPKKNRCLRFNPEVLYFKPRGIPLSTLEEEELFHDELEALKLHDVDGLDQIEAAKKMNVSQPTFGRILDKAYKKIATAIIKGKAIKIIKK
ncbi:MAG: DUF134 domain-containing protein [Candidatus Shapirobacteria bacterium]|nr:DUF134 domain-containing protein [Candidatus Shapirobacteria bacterium]